MTTYLYKSLLNYALLINITKKVIVRSKLFYSKLSGKLANQPLKATQDTTLLSLCDELHCCQSECQCHVTIASHICFLVILVTMIHTIVVFSINFNHKVDIDTIKSSLKINDVK